MFKEDSAVLDEPATAKALARYLDRGLVCGAHTEEFVTTQTNLSLEELKSLARTGRAN